ncbi:Olfactory receptor 14J1 [Lamprotornis superbus]|uniref:Olfactory receptor 14J1 n=1 Tax=Lamprotornis superbus TaxID=245042 RepID=A0A835NDK6_9PASS|nr:Olfactory receptor 14J1 [Lamprotornis superbus]
MSNSSSISLLLALADMRQLQLLHFSLFLGISLAALLANGLIISAVACGHHLHTPMFFFLLNLALSDLGCICTTQFSLLTIMCYDRYVSICKPLHYGTLLGSRGSAHMAAAAWASGFLNALLQMANTFSLPLCQDNALGQLFCEMLCVAVSLFAVPTANLIANSDKMPLILKLSCSNSYTRELGLLMGSAFLLFGCFVFIVFSYVQIFRAVLRIPSEQGWHKAFATCVPHLAGISLFISRAVFAYLKPPSTSSPSADLAVTVLYSVVPPALNPLIYCLRNQELKATVWTLMTGQIQEH